MILVLLLTSNKLYFNKFTMSYSIYERKLTVVTKLCVPIRSDSNLKYHLMKIENFHITTLKIITDLMLKKLMIHIRK